MFDDSAPIYLQIARMIRAQVLAGETAEEEQVMSTTEFATTFRINPATAAKAFALLVDEGVLYKRRGLGMFVAPGARDRLLEAHRETFFADVLDPALEQADVLGIPRAALVEHVLGRPAGADGSSPTTDTSEATP